MKIKKHLTYARKIKTFQSFVMMSASNGCQTDMQFILSLVCHGSTRITYANSMTLTMHREIRLALRSAKANR